MNHSSPYHNVESQIAESDQCWNENGYITVERVTKIDDVLGVGDPYFFLLVGPTGSGKSSFIEALAGPRYSLGIAKNQLDGFTQDLSAFKVINLDEEIGYPIYVVDCPGFADRKISENGIIIKIRKWMVDNRVRAFSHILYFIPITDTRLAGSKRYAINMFRELCHRPQSISVVTTMWDRVCNDTTRTRVDGNFEELKAGIWRDSTLVTKFNNQQSSSINVIKQVFCLPEMGILFNDTSPKLVYDNLLERIAISQQEIQFNDGELKQPDTQANEELREVFLAERNEAYERLRKFSREVVDFGPPPCGSEIRFIPFDVLTVGQNVKHNWRVVMRMMFGEEEGRD